MTTRQVEIAAMTYFDYRANLIVPGVSWGGNVGHECDLLVVRRPSYYGLEVEIKVSKADLVKDKEKRHGHRSDMIKELWFAMPSFLEPHTEHVPERAGILLFDLVKSYYREWGGNAVGYVDKPYERYQGRVVRKAEVNKHAEKFTEEEVQSLYRLGCLRVHSLMKRAELVEARNRELKAEVQSLKKTLAASAAKSQQ